MAVLARDVMGHVVIAVREDTPFADIVTTMKRFAVGAVAVIDADGRPVGIVSEDDLLLKETDTVRHSISIFESHKQRQEHRKAAGVTAAQLMTSPAITITPGTSVRDAARVMHDQRIKQLPVIDPVTGRAIGTLHQRDVLRVFTRAATELEMHVRAVLPDPSAFTVTVDKSVVTIEGKVEWHSAAIAIEEQARRVEGVVDVVSKVTYDKEDLLLVPPLL